MSLGLLVIAVAVPTASVAIVHPATRRMPDGAKEIMTGALSFQEDGHNPAATHNSRDDKLSPNEPARRIQVTWTPLGAAE